MIFSSRTWWVLDRGKPWEQWARMKSDGNVSFYDAKGDPIMRAHYGRRSLAVSSLKSRRFRKLRRKEIKKLQPPGSQRACEQGKSASKD